MEMGIGHIFRTLGRRNGNDDEGDVKEEGQHESSCNLFVHLAVTKFISGDLSAEDCLSQDSLLFFFSSPYSQKKMLKCIWWTGFWGGCTDVVVMYVCNLYNWEWKGIVLNSDEILLGWATGIYNVRRTHITHIL